MAERGGLTGLLAALDTVPEETLAARAEDLRSRLSPVSTVRADLPTRRLYGGDRGSPPPFLERFFRPLIPDLVVRPGNVEDLLKTLSWARLLGLPVTPRGAGSTAEGQSVSGRGGVVLDMTGLNRIVGINAEAQTVTVEGGATWGEVKKALVARNLELFTYPSSRFSTVGGWIATGGLGINAFGYGHLWRHVTQIEVAWPDGSTQVIGREDPIFDVFFGTEGQMGVVLKATLRVRPAPLFKRHYLFYLDSVDEQLALVEWLIADGVVPSHVLLLDRERMAELNRLHALEHPGAGQLVEERYGVFLRIESEHVRREMETTLEHLGVRVDEAPGYAAQAVWERRFFPLAGWRLGPGQLAVRMLMPLYELPEFMAEVRRLARGFGLKVAFETTVAAGAEPGEYDALVLITSPMSRTDRASRLRRSLEPLLRWLCVRWGGRPYEGGLYYGALNRYRLDRERYHQLLLLKRQSDPDGLFNPGKFPPTRPLSPAAFNLMARAGMRLAPVLGRVARAVGGQVVGTPDRLTEIALSCTGCGDCLAVCPAYRITGDEWVTGRGKLRLALMLASGERVEPGQSARAFLCTYCRACQDVCQTGLPLLEAYRELESRLEEAFGRPEGLIRAFLAELESGEEYCAMYDATPLPAPPRQAELHPQGVEPTGGQQPFTTDEGVMTRYTPPRRDLPPRYLVTRGADCVNCGRCTRACVYGVHSRDADDPRLMAEPASERCVGCFRCVQECPTGALSISRSPGYEGMGRGVYTPDVIALADGMATTGSPPAPNGPRNPQAIGWLNSLRLEAADLLRPPFDEAHVRTETRLGRRLERLQYGPTGEATSVLPPSVRLPYPLLLAPPPGTPPAALRAILEVARLTDGLALIRWPDWQGEWDELAMWTVLRVREDELDEAGGVLQKVRMTLVPGLERAVARLRTRHPDVVLAGEVIGGEDVGEKVWRLARLGADVAWLVGDDGLYLDSYGAERLPESAFLIRETHGQLVRDALRPRISLVAQGAITRPDMALKALLLGADAVAVDWPLLIALGCYLEGECAIGRHGCGLERVDSEWATQRLLNLVAAWQDELRSLAGYVGMCAMYPESRLLIGTGREGGL